MAFFDDQQVSTSTINPTVASIYNQLASTSRSIPNGQGSVKSGGKNDAQPQEDKRKSSLNHNMSSDWIHRPRTKPVKSLESEEQRLGAECYSATVSFGSFGQRKLIWGRLKTHEITIFWGIANS